MRILLAVLPKIAPSPQPLKLFKTKVLADFPSGEHAHALLFPLPSPPSLPHRRHLLSSGAPTRLAMGEQWAAAAPPGLTPNPVPKPPGPL